MSDVFVCPNCGAPQTTDGTQFTVTCPFCATTVVVPPELRQARRPPTPIPAPLPPALLTPPPFPTPAAPPVAGPRRRMPPCGCLIVWVVLVAVLYGWRSGGFLVPATNVFSQLVADQPTIGREFRFPTATQGPTSPPEPTATPRPSPSPTPTAMPPLNFSQTATFGGWVISLARIESRTTLRYSEAGESYSTKGRFWLIWADGRNTQNSTRSLNDDFTWQVRDDRGAHYAELGQDGVDHIATAVQLIGREPLDTAVLPRSLVHPLLLFQVAADARPVELVITNDESRVTVRFTLPHK